ncbi:MAG TPA: PilZ domain-containing protein, partial [Oscillatoriaceae cyanobacterium]
GGGCQLVGEKPFIANAIMRLRIPLPQKVIDVHGKVVRANPFPQGVNKRTYTSGFAFTKISEADREMLIKFIFEKMREDIKQGKTV